MIWWRSTHSILVGVSLFALASLLFIIAHLVVSAAGAPDEVRALWVLRASLVSPERIATVVRTAKASGFNTLLVQVRARGDAMFESRVEPRDAQIAGLPGFDPLKDVLAAAHAAGLKVHAWVSVNLVSSAAELPIARDHVMYRHPEWLMIPREIAEAENAEDQKSPAYIGALARWTRAHAQEVEGLYLSPISTGAASHSAAAITDLASRYDIDGIHLDYARYPNDDFDYSRGALAEFRAAVLPDLPVAERQSLDAQARTDLFAYTDALPSEWVRFRRSRLTALVMRIRTAVKAVRRDLVFSAAVAPDETEAASKRLQDWRTWLEAGLLDVVCPMAYTTELGTFVAQVAAARAVPGLHGVWAGVGSYRLSPAQTLEHIAAARAQGASGIAIFSYDSLVAVPNQPSYLADVGRLAFSGSNQTLTGSR
jgi:uncharacterized lipoprotein YddW (UPF0748 family)